MFCPSLAIRHGVASVATIVAACAVWTFTYVALLLWAAASNGGLGGPLAFEMRDLVRKLLDRFDLETQAVAIQILDVPQATYAGWETVVTGASILLSTGVAMAVGLASGIYPATRAASRESRRAA